MDKKGFKTLLKNNFAFNPSKLHNFSFFIIWLVLGLIILNSFHNHA